jgi:hypothetical protein
MAAEDNLLRCGRMDQLDDQTLYVQLFGHVLERLSAFLGIPMRADPELGRGPVSGCAVGVVSAAAINGALQLASRGIVFIKEREDGQGLEAGATLFLYCGGKQLRLSTGESFLDLTYTPDDQGPTSWVAVGWFTDEYDEYEEYDHFVTGE